MGKPISRVIVRVLSESEYDRWRTFVNAASSGSIYSLPEYLDILCAVGDGTFRIITAFQGDEIVGGLGLYEMRVAGATCVSSRLLLYYNGLVLKDYDSRYPSEITGRHLAATRAILDYLRDRRYPRVLLRNRHPVQDVRPFLRAGWKATPGYSYVVDVSDLDAAWQRIEQNLRRLIVRCESSGLVYSEDGDFADFYRLHTATHSRKGAPIYLPEGSFEEYYRRLKALGLAQLYQLRIGGGQSVAAQMVLFGGHPVTHTITTAADGAYMTHGINPYLRWRVMQAIHKRGFAANDLTDAALNSVTRFKSQFGGELVCNFVVRAPEPLFFRMREAGVTTAKRILGPAYLKVKGRR
jgi:hypothetical protein